MYSKADMFGRPETEYRIQKEEFDNKLQYLDKMPAAFAVMEPVLDDAGEPCDLRYIYVNEKLAELENKKKDEMSGLYFYGLHKPPNRDWLNIFYQTAYSAKEYTVSICEAELEKCLSVSTYCPEKGYCACIITDVTVQVAMERKNQREKKRMEMVLKSSLDTVFSFELKTRTIYADPMVTYDDFLIDHVQNIPASLIEKGCITKESAQNLEKVIQRLEAGERAASGEVQMKITKDTDFLWYHIMLMAYTDEVTGRQEHIGFLRDINQSVLKRKKYEYRSQRDPLTKIHNVDAGRSLAEKKITAQCSSGKGQAMFIFDLDNFKKINDTKGHMTGDLALKEFAAILRCVFTDRNVIYRLGGDEFAVFLYDVCDDKSLKALFKQVSERLKTQNSVIEGVSAGIAVSRDGGRDYEEFYEAADKALYESKRRGKDICFIVEF